MSTVTGKQDLRTDEVTRTMRVLAWGKVSSPVARSRHRLTVWTQGPQDPFMYYISADCQVDINLTAYPAIVQHVLGVGHPANSQLEIWNAEVEAWRVQDTRLPVNVDRHRSMLLVRYPANGAIRGAGRRIAALQRESFSKWLLQRLDEYVDGDADEVRWLQTHSVPGKLPPDIEACVAGGEGCRQIGEARARLIG